MIKTRLRHTRFVKLKLDSPEREKLGSLALSDKRNFYQVVDNRIVLITDGRARR